MKFSELAIGATFKTAPTALATDIKIERMNTNVKSGYVNAQCVDTGIRWRAADCETIYPVGGDQAITLTKT